MIIDHICFIRIGLKNHTHSRDYAMTVLGIRKKLYDFCPILKFQNRLPDILSCKLHTVTLNLSRFYTLFNYIKLIQLYNCHHNVRIKYFYHNLEVAWPFSLSLCTSPTIYHPVTGFEDYSFTISQNLWKWNNTVCSVLAYPFFHSVLLFLLRFIHVVACGTSSFLFTPEYHAL